MVRYITHSSPYANITPKYKKLNILKINELYTLEIGKFMYRSNKNMLPSSFDQYFDEIRHNYQTRSRTNNNLVMPMPRTDIGKQSIKFTGVKIWSDIPLVIKNANSLDNFSKCLNAHMINKPV